MYTLFLVFDKEQIFWHFLSIKLDLACDLNVVTCGDIAC